MGDFLYARLGDRWSETGVGTNAGVSVTHSGTTGKAQIVTGIQASGDAAAVVTIESPSGTKLYQKRFASAFTLSEAFPLGVIVGGSGSAVLVKVSASTSNCEANIQGAPVNA